MDKLKMESPNLTEQNIEKIGQLFPNAITEMRDEEGNLKKGINFEILKQELSGKVIDGEECYDFTWVGKKAAIVEANAPIRKTLRPYLGESKDWENTENLYIEGDNLDVLKLLQESYLNSVKMIYIDPPFNTGNDLIYKDNFTTEKSDFEEQIGLYDEEDNKMFRNTENNGRFHSDWCSMMYPRLKLAHSLLASNGAIFIHIDDNEYCNIKKISDEIFGEINFINSISVKTKVAGVSGSHMGKSLQNNVEHILFYCKNYNEFLIDNAPSKRQELNAFIKSMEINEKSWKYTSAITDIDAGKYIKSIKAGDGNEIKIYKHSKYEFKSVSSIANAKYGGKVEQVYYDYIDSIFRTTNAQSSIRTKVIKETKDIYSDLISIEYTPIKGKNAGQATRLFYKDTNRNLITFLKDVVAKEGDKIYKIEKKGNLWDDINYNNLANEARVSFPNGQKPIQLLCDLLKMFNQKDSIIMDFFSGSATTAHAVMQLNAEDGGNRKFIMVQLPEPTDEKSEAYKAGYENISEIGKERIRRAGEKTKEENNDKEGIEKLDIGFRVFKTDSTSMKDVYYAATDITQDSLDDMVSNIKEDRNDLDLLYGVLLDWGLPLSLKHEIEEIDGVTIHTYDQDSLVACFTEKVPEAVIRKIADRQPLRVVFRDSSFASSPEKINVEEIFKLLAPNTSVKVI